LYPLANFVGIVVGFFKVFGIRRRCLRLAAAFIFLLSHKDISGAVNLCSPNPLRNKDLGSAIGKVLHRPSFMPVLGFMIRLILGEFGDMRLKGQRVIPRRLLEAGFKFRYPDIDEALKNIILD
jgi:NAD dependent epimerase/dehydratase family enzyme